MQPKSIHNLLTQVFGVMKDISLGLILGNGFCFVFFLQHTSVFVFPSLPTTEKLVQDYGYFNNGSHRYKSCSR